MSDLEAAREHQQVFLQQLKAKVEPYVVRVRGIDIVVNPGVFPPVTDSQLLATHIRVKPGDRVLDLTTGSGVFSVLAGLQGATGVAGDLNPRAVVNADENFSRFKVNFKAVQTDLFENIPQDRFDFIFVNGPYTEGIVTDPIEYAFYGARRFIDRLFSQASAHLNPNGRILITFAEWGEVDFFENTASTNGFSLKIVDKKFSDHRRVYRLYEAWIS